MRRLIAKLYHGLVSQRDVARTLPKESAESILDSVKPLKDFQFEAYSEKTPYRQWIAGENIPIHTGYHIADVRQLAVGPWERLGALGAHVVVEGAEGTESSSSPSSLWWTS